MILKIKQCQKLEVFSSDSNSEIASWSDLISLKFNVLTFWEKFFLVEEPADDLRFLSAELSLLLLHPRKQK